MCGDMPRAAIECESHETRVNRDIKEYSPLLGVDLEMFRDFMLKNRDYAIIHFNVTVVFEDLSTFDSCIIDHKIACLLNKGVQPEWKFVPYEKMNEYVKMAYDRKEKDELREKLRAVGIDPIW